MARGSCVNQMTGDIEVFNKMTGRYEKLSHIIEPCFNWDIKGVIEEKHIDTCGNLSGTITAKINKRAYRKIMRALRKMAKENKKQPPL